jgi:hypothetical protein
MNTARELLLVPMLPASENDPSLGVVAPWYHAWRRSWTAGLSGLSGVKGRHSQASAVGSDLNAVIALRHLGPGSVVAVLGDAAAVSRARSLGLRVDHCIPHPQHNASNRDLARLCAAYGLSPSGVRRIDAEELTAESAAEHVAGYLTARLGAGGFAGAGAGPIQRSDARCRVLLLTDPATHAESLVDADAPGFAQMLGMLHVASKMSHAFLPERAHGYSRVIGNFESGGWVADYTTIPGTTSVLAAARGIADASRRQCEPLVGVVVPRQLLDPASTEQGATHQPSHSRGTVALAVGLARAGVPVVGPRSLLKYVDHAERVPLLNTVADFSPPQMARAIMMAANLDWQMPASFGWTL